MPIPDLNQSFENSKSKINSIKTYIETSNAAKDLKNFNLWRNSRFFKRFYFKSSYKFK